MTKEELKNFLYVMGKAVLKGGVLAKAMQGKVKNIGKHIDHAKEGTSEIAEVTEAKTVIDEHVQEILLKAAAACLDTKSVTVDGEEKTPSLSLFPNEKSDTVLVLDPIDGTLLYLNGKDNYRIVVGLLEKGKVISALIYFPVKDLLYFLDTDGRGKLAREFGKKGFTGTVALTLSKSKGEKVFVSYTITKDIVNKIKKAGYDVVRDLDLGTADWMSAFPALLGGEYSALIFRSPQIRDILLGAIVGRVKGVYVIDWEGNPLVWPPGGRVPKILFSIGEPSKDILNSIRNN